jgi:hypothetical protein
MIQMGKFCFKLLFVGTSLSLCCSLPTYSINKDHPVTVCKQRSTFFTEAKVKNATENIAKYEWARKEKDNFIKRADEWLADYHEDYSKLWDLIPSQKIPRSFAVNSLHGCLMCGTGINKYGNYSYVYDKHTMDWKLTCPNCHITFPTNDFKSYYEGGLEKDGKFNPSKAKKHNDELKRKGEKGNLVNLYSIKGLTKQQLDDLKAAGVSDFAIYRLSSDPSFGVDDGMGYRFNPLDKDKYGDPYTYVAYYSHWILWYWRVMPMLEDLSRAYMFTRYSANELERAKSQKYADAAIVLLDRVADLYPEMDVSAFPRNEYFGFPNSGYRWGTKLSAGRVVGSVWENTFVKAVMLAYDAVFPAIGNLSDKAKSVLVQKSGQSEKGSPNSIKVNFENGVLREVYKAFVNGDLQSNPGYQSTLALAAVLIDHNPETLDWLNLTFKNGKCEWHDVGKRTGGSVLRYIVDRISRDGIGDEVSMGYNSGWLPNWGLIARVLDGYQIPDGATLQDSIDANLYDNARFKKLSEVNYPLLLTDNFTPHIGDTGATGNPGHSIIDFGDLILGYSKYHMTEQAQAIYLLAGKELSKVHLDIYSKNPEDIQKDILNEIHQHGELNLTSKNISAYGLAMLRDGQRNDNSQRTMWMFYGTRNASHNHADPLSLGYIGYNLDLTPDFGYPNTLGGGENPEQQWDKSTPVHNTVSFDDLGYMGHVVGYGKPLHFDATKEVQLIHASSNEVENSNSLFAKQYDRTAAMIRIDDANSYYVDFFHVNSPKHYSYNYHTAEIDASATKYTNVTFSQLPSVTYNAKTLRNVKSASTEGKSFSIDWNVLDTWNCLGKGTRTKTDVHLKLTVLGQYKSITLGEAVPPTNVSGNPAWVPLLSVQSSGNTTFATVAEPYKSNTMIDDVEAALVREGSHTADENEVKAIKIKLKNGRTDYIVCSHDANILYSIDGKFDFKGFFGVCSLDATGKVVLRYINDGTTMAGMNVQDRISGTVMDATDVLSDKNYIVVKTDNPVRPEMFAGKYIYIDNSDIKDDETSDLLKYNTVYPIISASLQNDGTYRLDLGDCSVIRGWKNVNDYGKGYLRDFSLHSKFYIPLSFTNHK